MPEGATAAEGNAAAAPPEGVVPAEGAAEGAAVAGDASSEPAFVRALIFRGRAVAVPSARGRFFVGTDVQLGAHLHCPGSSSWFRLCHFWSPSSYLTRCSPVTPLY